MEEENGRSAASVAQLIAFLLVLIGDWFTIPRHHPQPPTILFLCIAVYSFYEGATQLCA